MAMGVDVESSYAEPHHHENAVGRRLAYGTESLMLHFLVRRTLHSVVTAGIVALALLWLLVHQMPLESQAELVDIVPQPLPPLTADQERANQAVLGYRACPSGPTIEQLIDSSLFGGPIGTVHLRSGSRVTQAAGAIPSWVVEIVLEHHYSSGIAGRRSSHEHVITFIYDGNTGQVLGRDEGGVRYLESARWECVREQSPYRRGPPEPVDQSPQ